MVKQSRQSASTARDGQTEQRILDAANAVFLRRGTGGARMQEIANEAGVNHALLHYYFRSKDQLATAVFQRAAGSLLPAVIKVLLSDIDLKDKVAAVVSTELDHLTRSPHLPAYIISEMAHHPERIEALVAARTGNAPGVIGEQVKAAVGRQIDAAVAAGTMRRIDPAQFIVNLISLCIFPFAARPMLMVMLGLDDEKFAAFIEQRRVELPEFFLKALQP